jgi:parallel beta-helix repeat protein
VRKKGVSMRIVVSLLVILIPFCRLGGKVLTVGKDSKYLSPHDAVSEAQNGDTVVITEGIYEFEKAISIFEKQDLTVKGKGDVRLICSNMEDNVFWIINSKNITVRGVRAKHANPTEDERCYGNVFGIDCSDDIIIEDCEIHGCGAIGVYIYISEDITLRNNYIHDNTIWAYQFDGVGFLKETSTIASLFLEGNTIENNGRRKDGLVVEEGFTIATFIGVEEGENTCFLFASEENGDTVRFFISDECEKCLDIENDPSGYIGSTMEIEWQLVESFIEERDDFITMKRIHDIVVLE